MRVGYRSGSEYSVLVLGWHRIADQPTALDGEMPDGYRRARRAASRARRAQRCAVEPFATLGAARLSDNNDSLTRYKSTVFSAILLTEEQP